MNRVSNYSQKSPHILILGATGLVGSTVYRYLHKKYPSTTWGTQRSNTVKHLIPFHAENVENDIKNIVLKKKTIDIVINCIGLRRDSSVNLKELSFLNSLFPQMLSQHAETHRFKLIHISTDAVFNDLQRRVNENMKPNPDDVYGLSKLLGEPDAKHTITFRTSFIGFDHRKHVGLFEWVIQTKAKSITGYKNQKWSGCTNVQFAQLCYMIIAQKLFQKLRRQSAVFHFAPISSISKFKLIETIIHVAKLNRKLVAGNGKQINRTLDSLYGHALSLDDYQRDISTATQELLTINKELFYE